VTEKTAYELTPGVPEWWGAEFRDRHIRICRKLLAVLRDAPVGYHLDALIFLGTHWGFSALETELAVFTMTADGRLVGTSSSTQKVATYGLPREVPR
jgi:hypothetical protein